MSSIESSDTMRQIKRTHFVQRFSEYYEQPIKKITPLQLDAWRADLSKNDNYAFRTKIQLCNMLELYLIMLINFMDCACS